MVCDSMRLPVSRSTRHVGPLPVLALWAAVIAGSGCLQDHSASYGLDAPQARMVLSDTPGGALLAAEGGLTETGPSDLGAFQITRGDHGTIGVELGEGYLREGNWSGRFDDGAYYGIRYSRVLGLNWGLSLTAGCLMVKAEEPGLADLEAYPVKVTLELGTYIGTTLSRWYIGGGGGYTFTDVRDAEPALNLPAVDDEPSTHVVVGIEFRNETSISTRVEGSHDWLADSDTDRWGATFGFAFQF